MNPYLFFDGSCEEAFTFYAEALGGQLVAILRQSEAPPEAQSAPPECMLPPEKVMHACVVVQGQMLMGSDSPKAFFSKPQGFAVQLAFPTPAEAERVFAALSPGATVTMPIAETFWAQRFGMLVDRFGTPWMVNCMKTEMGCEAATAEASA